MRRALLLVTLCGCGLQGATRLDGGAGGPGGGSTGGGDATGGGSAGGSSTAGGVATGGGVGTYVYMPAAIDDPADAGRVLGISGPAMNLFATSTYGKLYRSTDGQQFNRVFNAGRFLHAVYVAATGEVFLSSDADLGVCLTPPCVTAGAFTWSRPPGTAADTYFYALCGDSRNNVYAVGTRVGEQGVVVRFNGTSWSAEGLLGVNNAHSCWLESSNTLWASGLRQVSKWTGSFGVAEGADLTALGQFASVQLWLGVFGVSGELHAVGWMESIMSRTTGGSWSLTLNNSSQMLALYFRTVAALHPREVFAVGTPPSCSNCGNRVWRWNGTQWNTAPSLPIIGQVRTSHVVPNVIYVGGQVDGPAETAAIIRIIRQ